MIIRTFILERNSITRAGVRAHLQPASDIRVSGEAADAGPALEAINSTKPGVVLLGAAVYRQEGDRLLRRLLDIDPQPGLVILADHEDADTAERALKAGALGYVAREVDALGLVTAIRRVARGDVVVSQKVTAPLLQHLVETRSALPKDVSQVLSPRELVVFGLTGEGLEAKEIADRLSISPRTVDVHRANIRNKLGIQGTHELMRHATLWTQQAEQQQYLSAFGRKASPLLLVEDDEVDIMTVDRALRELGAGVELVAVRTAPEALDHLRRPGNARPGLVLLDLKLPGMDGHEFLAIIRNDPVLCTLPVVVLTASQLDADRARMHALGITGYLAKTANAAGFADSLRLLARYWSINEPAAARPVPNPPSAPVPVRPRTPAVRLAASAPASPGRRPNGAGCVSTRTGGTSVGPTRKLGLQGARPAVRSVGSDRPLETIQ